MNFKILETTGFTEFDEEALKTLSNLDGYLENLGMDSHRDRNLMIDLAAITATEINLINHAPVLNPTDLFPIKVTGNNLDLMIIKTDTLPTLECKTPQRVFSGDYTLTDLFIFSSDIEKLLKFYKNDISIDTIKNDFDQVMESFLGRTSELLFGDNSEQTSIRFVLKAESAVWRLRMSLLTHPEQEDQNSKEFEEYASRMELPLRVPLFY
jgi:hypothetical protein